MPLGPVMKYLLYISLLFSATVFACGEELKDLSDDKKFIAAIERADFVYFGNVIRLYTLPETANSFPHYNGYVFWVDEVIKGKVEWDYMEAEQSSMCGVNSPLTENYWPDDINQEFVVAGRYVNGENHIIAVYPTELAMNILYDMAEASKR